MASSEAMLASSKSALNGFVMYMSAPVCNPSMHCCSLLRAVSSNTGMWLVASCCLRRVQNVSPSITGIITSDTTMSGTLSTASFSPLCPSAASIT